jgi:hypothetical protein
MSQQSKVFSDHPLAAEVEAIEYRLAKLERERDGSFNQASVSRTAGLASKLHNIITWATYNPISKNDCQVVEEAIEALEEPRIKYVSLMLRRHDLIASELAAIEKDKLMEIERELNKVWHGMSADQRESLRLLFQSFLCTVWASDPE